MRSRLLMTIAALATVTSIWTSGPAQASDLCRCVDHDCRQEWCVKDLLP